MQNSLLHLYFSCWPPSSHSGMHISVLFKKWYFHCPSKTRAPKCSSGLFHLAMCQLYHAAVYWKNPLKLLVYFFFFLPLPQVTQRITARRAGEVARWLLCWRCLQNLCWIWILLSHRSDDHGFSPLHWACREGRSSVVDMLIMRGARINVMNRGDDTPLHLASSHGHRNIEGKVGSVWTPGRKHSDTGDRRFLVPLVGLSKIHMYVFKFASQTQTIMKPQMLICTAIIDR